MRASKIRSELVWAGILAGFAGAATGNATETSSASVAPADSPSGAKEEPLAKLHAAAESLWNDFAPESVKGEYELIGREELLALFTRLTAAGQQADLARLASYAPEARAAIEALGFLPDLADYADWLRGQLDDMEAAGEAAASPSVPPPVTPPVAPIPDPVPTPAPVKVANVPLYELWVARVARRPRPAGAAALLPAIRAAFAAEGVPEALVWLAETESAFNPSARSPVGARGLFQLMPDTAKSLGLSLLPSDQRTQPQASARAAAAYLKKLHGRFGDWPLALAAYNGGEGRVARTLKERGAADFAGIAEYLPAETRLYVPKVLATVRVRAGVAPAELAAPVRVEIRAPVTTPGSKG